MQRLLALSPLWFFALFAATTCFAQHIPVQDGQQIAFLGDSITQFGWDNPFGYVHLVMDGLEANGIHARAVPAGVSGNTSKDMLARLDRHVLSYKPDWMTLSCGVNDVWHGATGVPLDQYKQNITEIVDRAQAQGIKVMILTSTMIEEHQSNAFNQKLIAYNDFLRDLAKQKGCILADLNADMQAALAAAPPHKGNLLTVDGVHMNAAGNEMMAAGILKAFGLSDAQLQTAQQAWLDIPNAFPISTPLAVTQRQYNQLSALAAQQGITVQQLMAAKEKQTLDDLLHPAPPATAP